MKHISRGIWVKQTPRFEKVFVFKVKHKVKGEYLSLDMAENARKEYDFEKEKWTCIGTACTDKIKTDFMSRIKQDLTTGCWYAEVVLVDDILVSDLYRYKKEIEEIRKFLDNEKWSVTALNLQKRIHNFAPRKYAGILPTKEGYLVKDTEGKKHGTFETVEEAVTKRDLLRNEGVVI